MAKFILIFLLIYGGIHAVFYRRLSISFPLKGWMAVGVTLFLILMVLSPMISRVLESRGNDPTARLIAHAGYVWMGFIFYAFLGSLCLYLMDAAFWIAGLVYSKMPVISHRVQMTGLLGLIAAVMMYGFYEANALKVERITISTAKLPSHVDSIRIVQISDIHLGIINRDRMVNRIMEMVEAEKPDMFVCTGDLVDGSLVNLMRLGDRMQAVDPSFGKFAITGNHEYYVGLDHSIEFIRHAGFTLLQQEIRTVQNAVNVVGVDDGGRYQKVDASKILRKIDNDLFTVYLVHRPDISPAVQGLYDLQLSGHTHKGQLFPFNYIVGLQFPLLNGFHEMMGNSKLYVSRGTGTWGPPMRVLSRPEITVFDIVGSP